MLCLNISRGGLAATSSCDERGPVKKTFVSEELGPAQGLLGPVGG